MPGSFKRTDGMGIEPECSKVVLLKVESKSLSIRFFIFRPNSKFKKQ